MSFFISNAVAATSANQAGQANGTFSLFMIVALFVLFYVMLIRPQNKRAKEHRELVSKIKKGDEIVISGAILGKVVNLDEQYVKVALSEGVEATIQRNAVSTILPKGTLKSI